MKQFVLQSRLSFIEEQLQFGAIAVVALENEAKLEVVVFQLLVHTLGIDYDQSRGGVALESVPVA